MVLYVSTRGHDTNNDHDSDMDDPDTDNKPAFHIARPELELELEQEISKMIQTRPTAAQTEHKIFIPVDNSLRNRKPLRKPNRSLIDGDREGYLNKGLPLYKASIRCDWKAAKRILDKNPELITYSITTNGDTSLHVAASVNRSKHVETFVKNMMLKMNAQDLELINESSDTALYLAAACGKVGTVRIMMETNKNLHMISGGGGLIQPLHAAALYGNYEVVKYLYQISDDLSQDAGWNSENRGWLLRKCVEGDMFDVALKIVKKYPDLGSVNILGNLARKAHAFSGKKTNIIERSINSVFALIGLKVGAYETESEALQVLRIIWNDIAKRPKEEIDTTLMSWNDFDELKIITFLQLKKMIFELLDKLDVETLNMTGSTSSDQTKKLKQLIMDHIMNMDHETKKIISLTSGNQDKARYLQDLIHEHKKNMWHDTKKIMQDSKDEDKVSDLQKLIWENISTTRSAIALKESQSRPVQFIAAEMGNTHFLAELIRQYPDMIPAVDMNEQSIFHIAIKHRHEGIYNMLYEIGSMKNAVTFKRDIDDNTMLHLAGKGVERDRLADVSGAALQMQREVLWFKEVWDMIPPVYREYKNKEGLTPQELFTKEHKELITEGEKWMKETASQCMVVAALIATIVFAVAFTVPGGYNQNDGIPLFYRKPIFVVFVVADAISLFLSSTSILTFLSILTSRYAERDFANSLPNKLMLGVTTLFLSITSMMITFGVSFFILYHQEMKWIPIVISVLAVTPVLLYVLLQHHMLADVIRSIYGSRLLFKPGKQFLY